MARTISMKGSSGKGKSSGAKSGFFGNLKTQAQSVGAKLGLTSAPKIDKRHHLTAEEWAVSGQWVNGKSSNVSALAYNSERHMLFVELGVGNRAKSYYVYLGVEKNKAKSFFNAGSLGKWIWREMRRKNVPYKGPLTSINKASRAYGA